MNKDQTRVTVDQLLAMARQTVVRKKREQFIDEAHSLLAVSDLLAWIDSQLKKNDFSSEDDALWYVAGYMDAMADAKIINVMYASEGTEI